MSGVCPPLSVRKGALCVPPVTGEAGLSLLLWLFRRFLFPFAARGVDHDGLSAIDVGGKNVVRVFSQSATREERVAKMGVCSEAVTSPQESVGLRMESLDSRGGSAQKHSSENKK